MTVTGFAKTALSGSSFTRAHSPRSGPAGVIWMATGLATAPAGNASVTPTCWSETALTLPPVAGMVAATGPVGGSPPCGAAQAPAVHEPKLQSRPEVHFVPSGQFAPQGPPQSMPASPPFWTPSAHEAAWQVSPAQTPEAH